MMFCHMIQLFLSQVQVQVPALFSAMSVARHFHFPAGVRRLLRRTWTRGRSLSMLSHNPHSRVIIAPSSPFGSLARFSKTYSPRSRRWHNREGVLAPNPPIDSSHSPTLPPPPGANAASGFTRRLLPHLRLGIHPAQRVSVGDMTTTGSPLKTPPPPRARVRRPPGEKCFTVSFKSSSSPQVPLRENTRRTSVQHHAHPRLRCGARERRRDRVRASRDGQAAAEFGATPPTSDPSEGGRASAIAHSAASAAMKPPRVTASALDPESTPWR